jgi:ribosomal protein S18 acetylase RimI-like enzyme
VSAAGSDDDVAASCHANCIEYARESARRSGAAGEIAELGGVLLYATASDFPVMANGAFRLDPAVPAAQVIDVADAWFAERGRGWSLGTTSWADGDQDLIDAAIARGLVTTTDMAAMVCDERLADAVPSDDAIELRQLVGDDDSAAFVAMSDRAYTSLGLPEGVLAAMSPPPMRTEPPHLVTVGAFQGDDLVSGAQVALSHGIAGVYCVGTAETARGRGLAELVTRAVTNIGFDAGAALVTLQASPMGDAIYRRMGYRELYRYATHTRFA